MRRFRWRDQYEDSFSGGGPRGSRGSVHAIIDYRAGRQVRRCRGRSLNEDGCEVAAPSFDAGDGQVGQKGMNKVLVVTIEGEEGQC